VRVAAIREDTLYGGMRVTLNAILDTAQIPIQIDIGIGDAVVPEPSLVEFPTLLGQEAPVLRAYGRETVIAEKLHTIVVLGLRNSRMKDYFDLHLLGSHYEYDGTTLLQAVVATFHRRQTVVPTNIPQGLTREFGEDAEKSAQWDAFLRRQQISTETLPLPVVVAFLREFLTPISSAANCQGEFKRAWLSSGEWVASAD
jgi:Nucleotidyl transferase AbiEii toxin, Type IV TA system